MPISLILTPFDHFQNMSSGGIGPDLILTLCRTHYAVYKQLTRPDCNLLNCAFFTHTHMIPLDLIMIPLDLIKIHFDLTKIHFENKDSLLNVDKRILKKDITSK